MSMPWPLHTRMAGDTDIFIRDLAYAADAALSQVVKMFPGSGTVTTDANGDVLCDFKTATTLTGVLIALCTDSQYENNIKTASPGPVKVYPQPPSGYTIGPSPIHAYPREFVANQGKVWCRITTCVMKGPGTSQWYGAQPAAAGVSMDWRGIAWSGTST